MEEGDHVRYKGIGKVMTVLTVKGKTVECGWMDYDNGWDLKTGNFLMIDLVLF